MSSAPPPLDSELLAVVDRYRTCEFATLSKSGVPIAWPTSPLRRPDGTFLITTSIALPQKTFNIRRDPRVAMLFSEPTASGVTGAPQLLIQGTAVCPDEIVTEIGQLKEYWRRLYQWQPANRMYSANPITRWLFDWYYMRLLITVTPTSWSTYPPLPPGPPTRTEPAPQGVAAEALRRLADFSSAVLGTRGADGMPQLQRVQVTSPAGSQSLALDVSAEEALTPGPASLLAHFHDQHLWSLHNMGIIGELARTGNVWTFTPQRIISGLGTNPVVFVRSLRDLRRATRTYLDRRSLSRPAIPWNDFHKLRKPAPRAATTAGHKTSAGT